MSEINILCLLLTFTLCSTQYEKNLLRAVLQLIWWICEWIGAGRDKISFNSINYAIPGIDTSLQQNLTRLFKKYLLFMKSFCVLLNWYLPVYGYQYSSKYWDQLWGICPIGTRIPVGAFIWYTRVRIYATLKIWSSGFILRCRTQGQHFSSF